MAATISSNVNETISSENNIAEMESQTVSTPIEEVASAVPPSAEIPADLQAAIATIDPLVEAKPAPVTTAAAAVQAEHKGREESPLSEGSNASVEAADTGAVPKKESKGKKSKEDKGIEHVLKALSSLESTEEKLAALCKKYTDLLEEHRQLQGKHKQSQRKLQVLSREKDQLQSEHSKAVLAKSKLESLCRELQRHNKLVKEESLARAKEEEEKRKEVTAKFQTTINEIQSQMNEHYTKNTKLREENIELANKLKSLIEQYELREKHIEKVFKHKELEQQLVDAKLAQSSLQLTEMQEQGLQEKKTLLEDAMSYQKKIHVLEAQETQLRAQVSLYTEKYEEFQSTLAKSNEVFASFKSEMDKMTKKIKKLEKETTMWKSRWENSNKALLDMAEEKTRSDKDITGLNSKVHKLENLCRALQQRCKTEGKDTNLPTTNTEDGLTVKEVVPTKTPPNTPEQSRASPVTVQENSPGANSSPQEEASQSEQSSQEESNSNSQSDQPSQAADGQSEPTVHVVVNQSEPTSLAANGLPEETLETEQEAYTGQSEISQETQEVAASQSETPVENPNDQSEDAAQAGAAE